MIKNILFDLGGVLYDIRYQNVPEAFARLGFTDFDTHFTQAAQSGPIDLFEEGKISVPEFQASSICWSVIGASVSVRI